MVVRLRRPGGEVGGAVAGCGHGSATQDEGDSAGRSWWRAALVLRARRSEGDGGGRREVEKGAVVARAFRHGHLGF